MAATMTRKGFLAGAGAAGALALAPRPARAARQTVIKLGLDLAADHPTTVHAIAAAARIKAATDDAVRLDVFPNSELGDDTHMLSEVRSGAIQMMAIGDNILSSLVPAAAISNVGFAFKSAQTAWQALDGTLGDAVRADIEKAGLHPMHSIWDEGFRQVTTSEKAVRTPDDLKGFKIRVPPSPISLSLFQALGAAPATINIAGLYTALQTHVVDGQENPLGNIETQKLYQVQKTVSLTNHMWVGYWMLMNGPFWKNPACFSAATNWARSTVSNVMPCDLSVASSESSSVWFAWRCNGASASKASATADCWAAGRFFQNGPFISIQ